MSKKQAVTKHTLGKIIRKNSVESGDTDLTNVSQSQIDYIVDSLFAAITEALIADNNVVIKEFGTFRSIECKERYYKTPSGDIVHKDAQNRMSFSPSKKITDYLNK